MISAGVPLRILALGVLICVPACTGQASDIASFEQRQTNNAPVTEAGMKVRITAGDNTYTAVLDESASGRDLAALLPLTLILSDFNHTEKIADLPRRLSIDDAPDGYAPVAGDLAYYAPWGSLAIFYRDFRHSPGLVRLGRIQGNISQLSTLEGAVRIERFDDTDQLYQKGI